ncbi:MAG: SDR family oxidoreductase [Hyphomonadaceae bacterium]
MSTARINPVTLITGAASGIGAACAQHMAQHADGGLILIDGNEDALDASADALQSPPERVSTLTFDVADPARWEMASQFITSQYGRLDWAVIDAGSGTDAALQALSNRDARREVTALLDAAWTSLRAILPLMAPNVAGGAIVVCAPAAALKSEFGAPKTGLPQFLRVAAKEAGPQDVRVNALVAAREDDPAWRKAPVIAEIRRDTAADVFANIARQQHPIARFEGALPLTQLAAGLLSDDVSVSGVTLVASGANAL